MTEHSRRTRRTERLASARLYLCIDARRHLDDEARGQGYEGDFPALRRDAGRALAGGVDIVQLRDKNSAGDAAYGPLEALHELRALAVLAELCAEHDALLAVNDRADLARAAGADVLHLGQDDLPPELAREIVGDGMLVGRSCHAAAEVDAALADTRSGLVDYFCTGPVWPTPTKPGRHAPGLDLVRHAAAVADPDVADSPPWFAIGGVDASNLDEVLDAGARRIVVVRAITGSGDPEAAARALRERL